MIDLYKIDAEGVHYPRMEAIKDRLSKEIAADMDGKIAASLVALGWSPPSHLDKLRALRNHWNEFGPKHGFEDVLERACEPIDINKGHGSTWDDLPKPPRKT